MAIAIADMDLSQRDETIEKSGPAKRVAYDASGNLTKAGEGFIAGAGVSASDVYIISTTKGEYLAAKVFIAGKKTIELLPGMMKNAIERIVYPKTMRWGEHQLSFARPIRWIVSLLDRQIVDFEYSGVKSGRTTYGNRYKKLENSVCIDSVDEYVLKMKTVQVIVDRAERREKIYQSLLTVSSGKFISDERLLDTVTDMVEFPTAVLAEFDNKYLKLPEKIITSTLSQNQKYFSITDDNKKLVNKFIFISNGDPAYSDIIRTGNEKVVRARLADAEFYYTEDTKQPLEKYIDKLSGVVFHAKLGSLLDKTNRVESLCKYFADKLNLDVSKTDDLVRAAKLSKADQVTLMLGEKEFTKLQGYIGQNYAFISGEKAAVADAIYEHYMPRGQNDELPGSNIGAILAIADKLDTLCGIIGIGLLPTGSGDPFGLRRLGNGIVQIIDRYRYELSIQDMVQTSLSLLSNFIDDIDKPQSVVNSFLKQRVRWLLEDIHRIEYDVIDSLESFAWDNLLAIKTRAIDLQSFKSQAEFQTLVSSFQRVKNILEKNKETIPFNKLLLVEEAEIKLFEHLQKIISEVKPFFENHEYAKIMEKLVPLGASIDLFFDKVLVMCPDEALSQNRLSLLTKIRELFIRVADLSKILNSEL
jgi:glycyl-tRNA synthetase beta chain